MNRFCGAIAAPSARSRGRTSELRVAFRSLPGVGLFRFRALRFERALKILEFKKKNYFIS